MRAKLVLARNYAVVAVRERWTDSLLVLEKVLPDFFTGAANEAAVIAASRNVSESAKKRKSPNVSEMEDSDFLGPRRRQLLSQQTLQKLKWATKLDAELYAHANALLDAQARACVSTRRLSIFAILVVGVLRVVEKVSGFGRWRVFWIRHRTRARARVVWNCPKSPNLFRLERETYRSSHRRKRHIWIPVR